MTHPLARGVWLCEEMLFSRLPALLLMMPVKVEGPVWALRLRIVVRDSKWERFIVDSFSKRNNIIFW